MVPADRLHDARELYLPPGKAARSRPRPRNGGDVYRRSSYVTLQMSVSVGGLMCCGTLASLIMAGMSRGASQCFPGPIPRDQRRRRLGGRMCGRDLNPHCHDPRPCPLGSMTGRVTAGHRVGYVSEGDCTGKPVPVFGEVLAGQRWPAMSGADLVTRWWAVPTVIGVAAAGLFRWLYERRDSNGVQDPMSWQSGSRPRHIPLSVCVQPVGSAG